MKIAIVGAGISGLTAAYYLNQKHDITLFEAAEQIGGHTATKKIRYQGETHNIDTGFIVFNDWTYPNFIQLLNEIGVQSQPTSMGFSVKSALTGIEYSGSGFKGIFSQKRNLFRPGFLRMLKDIARFNKEATSELESGTLKEGLTLGEYLTQNRYSDLFISHYLIPMGCAIWSASEKTMLEFPLLFFVRFFRNHGLLSIKNRPQWRVLKGGSHAYLGPLTQAFQDKIQVNAQISGIQRVEGGVLIHRKNALTEKFDQVILACHSDQALALLDNPTKKEKEILGAMLYQDNEVVLHTDTRLLPQRKSAWSSWNYWLTVKDQKQAVLTYNMNILQQLNSKHTFCVTLNATDEINPDTILGQYNYAHPVFTQESVAAANQWETINGMNNTWFCGAYWGNGFHEDGVVSALRVVNQIQPGN
ncbi:NAD(P)/FAD-dependent oxidoreductase [Teredinibacter sp. KSP-S5-2]|uniref:NAD(P)/FAD-dependent oxidoreductase n=1 Tax=Teredinibacter sp. KSP-S5-2 TaxID=3034506 RepID=UPI002934A0A4|nr:FAD-dependent oxidoreductase [Teredinibacter sp. KSP-S5-2]WNO08462.1 FAD-dependent oxidoreductase [Teredinibacter sp. KSP-S5-2]